MKTFTKTALAVALVSLYSGMVTGATTVDNANMSFDSTKQDLLPFQFTGNGNKFTLTQDNPGDVEFTAIDQPSFLGYKQGYDITIESGGSMVFKVPDLGPQGKDTKFTFKAEADMTVGSIHQVSEGATLTFNPKGTLNVNAKGKVNADKLLNYESVSPTNLRYWGTNNVISIEDPQAPFEFNANANVEIGSKDTAINKLMGPISMKPAGGKAELVIRASEFTEWGFNAQHGGDITLDGAGESTILFLANNANTVARYDDNTQPLFNIKNGFVYMGKGTEEPVNPDQTETITKNNLVVMKGTPFLLGDKGDSARVGQIQVVATEKNQIDVNRLLSLQNSGANFALFHSKMNRIEMTDGFQEPVTSTDASQAGIFLGGPQGFDNEYNLLIASDASNLGLGAASNYKGQDLSINATKANLVLGQTHGLVQSVSGDIAVSDDEFASKKGVRLHSPFSAIVGVNGNGVFINNTLPRLSENAKDVIGVRLYGSFYLYGKKNAIYVKDGFFDVNRDAGGGPMDFDGSRTDESNTVFKDNVVKHMMDGIQVPTEGSSIDGNLVSLNSQTHVALNDKTPFVGKMPFMVVQGGKTDLDLSLATSVDFTGVPSNVKPDGTAFTVVGSTDPVSVLNLKVKGQWNVMHDEKTPASITPVLSKLETLESPRIVMSPAGRGGSKMIVAEKVNPAQIFMTITKDPSTSDMLLVGQSTGTNTLTLLNPESTGLTNPGDKALFAVVMKETDPLFKVGEANELNKVKADDPYGSITSQTFKIERVPNSEGAEKGGQVDYGALLGQPLMVAEVNQGTQEVTAKDSGQKIGAWFVDKVGALYADKKPSDFINYYLTTDNKVVDNQVTPVLPTVPTVDYDITVGQVDSLSKRGGAIRRLGSPVWARTSFYKADRQGHFSVKNTSLEVGYDLINNDTHRVSVGLSGLQGTAKLDNLSGKATAKQVGLHAYYTLYLPAGFYADFHGLVNRVTDKLDYMGSDNSSLAGKYSHWNAGVSVEAGKPFTLGSHTVTPQVQLQYLRLGGAAWQNGVTQYRLKSGNSLVGRAGLDYSYQWATGSGLTWKAKVSGNVYYEFDGRRQLEAQDLIRSITSTASRRGAWTGLGVGVEGQVAKLVNVYANLERSAGRQNNRAWEANLGVAFGW